MDHDAAFDRHHQHAMIACALWPIAIVILAPEILGMAWLGMLLLLASVLQFLWLPHAYAEWRARKS